jgi:hypothetical protein
MKICVIHDAADVFRATGQFPRLAAHGVVIHNDASIGADRVVERVNSCRRLPGASRYKRCIRGRWARSSDPQSTWMPAVLITFAHFAISALM